MLQGSKARAQWVGTECGYKALYQQLLAEGVLLPEGFDQLVFSRDYAFTSPSAAAAVVSGRSANGRTSWLVQGTKQSYAAWQDQQLSGLEPVESNAAQLS